MNRTFVAIFLKLTAAVIVIFTGAGCAYKLSSQVDALPNQVKRVHMPVFSNKSTEAGVEVYFTESLKTEAIKSGLVQLASTESESDAILTGVINEIEVIADESVIEARDNAYLPNSTVLSTQTKVTVSVSVFMKKKNSSEILWSSEFKQSRYYTPPQVTLPVINTANNLYNLSGRRQTLETLSKEMMQLAFDRLVDNF